MSRRMAIWRLWSVLKSKCFTWNKSACTGAFVFVKGINAAVAALSGAQKRWRESWKGAVWWKKNLRGERGGWDLIENAKMENLKNRDIEVWKEERERKAPAFAESLEEGCGLSESIESLIIEKILKKKKRAGDQIGKTTGGSGNSYRFFLSFSKRVGGMAQATIPFSQTPSDRSTISIGRISSPNPAFMFAYNPMFRIFL